MSPVHNYRQMEIFRTKVVVTIHEKERNGVDIFILAKKPALNGVMHRSLSFLLATQTTILMPKYSYSYFSIGIRFALIHYISLESFQIFVIVIVGLLISHIYKSLILSIIYLL